MNLNDLWKERQRGKIMIKCDQEDCDKEAIHTVFWPGKNPPPVYCEKHAEKAIYILKAMGVPVNFRPIVFSPPKPSHIPEE